MTIATEKLKQSIRRDTLVKITVMMDATDHLTLVSGNNYKVSIPIGATYEPVAAYQDGSSITSSWNSSTNELTITKTQTIGDDYPVTVKFYIYLTTGQAKYLDKDDPTGTISTVAEWLPKLEANVTQKEFVRDIFAGNFPVATGSSFSLINDDDFFGGFFERYEDYICPFYFFNQEVKIWIGLNDSYEYIGNYIIETMSIKDSTQIQFNLKPEVKKLMASATFGDSDNEIVATVGNYSNLKPDLDGTPIPLIFSPNTGIDTQAGGNYGYPLGYYNDSTGHLLNRAIPIDYSAQKTSSNNLVYLCGRSPIALGSANKEIPVSGGIPSNTQSVTGTQGTFLLRKATITNQVDYHSIVGSMVVDVYFSSSGWQTDKYLSYVDASTHEIWLAVFTLTGETITKIRRKEPVQLWFRAPNQEPFDPTFVRILNEMVPIYYTTYTITQTATKGGNYLIQASVTDSSALLLPDYDYYFTFFTDSLADSPEEIAYSMLDAVNLSHNHSDTSSKSNPAFFQIPRAGETEYKTYADYLPEIIRPMTMSMLRFNYSTGYYSFIEMPSTIDSSGYPGTYHDITDSDIIDKSLTYSKKYNDVVTKLICKNTDIQNKEVRLHSSKTYNNKRESTNYSTDKIHEINHAGLFPNTSPYNLASVNEMLRTPVVRYTLSVGLKFFDIKVLDVIKLTSTKVINNVNDGTEFIYLVVTSIEKGSANIKIEGEQVTYL